MTSEAQSTLIAGAEILGRVLRPHGFIFRREASGKGSGGEFSSGAFYRDNRHLELHFRYSLGLVCYHIDQCSLEHETYMRLLGVYGKNRYPDFSADALQPFHHLADDIEKYCDSFTVSDGREFCELALSFQQNPMMFKGIS